MVLLRLASQFLQELHITRARPDVGRDAFPYAHVLGRVRGAVDQSAIVHWPEVDVRQVHQLHFGVLQVGDGEAQREQGGISVELHQWLSEVIVVEGHGILIPPAEAHVGAFFLLADDQIRPLIGSVGQLAVQGVGVVFGRDAHGRRTAVQEEAAVVLQVHLGRLRFGEHRLHGQIPPVERRRPDLLSLKGQHDEFASLVLEPQPEDAALKAECRGRQ